jgi:hypothetical protein
MRRARLVVAALLGMLLATAGWQSPAPASERLYRASARASGIHGFFDHRDLFPVPILDLSAPYSEATIEPGPSSRSLGSFAWEPDAAALPTILCVLSGNQLCGLPDYPFQARATYPSAKKQAPPPVLTINEPGAPVAVRAAWESAEATADKATADASTDDLHALPMSGTETDAARRLAEAISAATASRAVASSGVGGLATAGGPAASASSVDSRPDGWLITLSAARSATSVGTPGARASARASSYVSRMELLGGLIRLEGVRGSAYASVGPVPSATADAGWTRAVVGELHATLGPGGLRVDDQTVGKEQLRAIQTALDQALAQSGLSISLGRHRTHRDASHSVAESYAFSLDLSRQLVPGQAPDATSGEDVLQVPVAYARAEAQVAVQAGNGGDDGDHQSGGGKPSPAPTPSEPAPQPTHRDRGPGGGDAHHRHLSEGGPVSDETTSPEPAGGNLGPTGSGEPTPASVGSTSGPAPARHAVRHPAAGRSRDRSPPRTTALAPAFAIIDLGVPFARAVLVLLVCIGFVAGMTYLKVLESLTE